MAKTPKTADTNDQPKADAGQPARTAAFVRIADVRGLPEVPADAELEPIAFEINTIERFTAGEEDRRVMQVVGFAGGFASQEVA